MKNKKLLVSLGLVVCLALGSVMGVLADGPMSGDQTDNKITFTKGDGGDGGENPGNPEEPDKELPDPDEPKVEPQPWEGPIGIKALPNFDFGSSKVSEGEDRVFFASAPMLDDDEKHAYFAQVTDLRGEGTGFTLSAQMTKQFTNTTAPAGKQVLTSAYIDLLNGQTTAESSTDAPGLVAVTAKLDYNSVRKIMSTEAGEVQGMGKSFVKWGAAEDDNVDESVKLTIPKGENVFVGEYKATIKWTLTEGPSDASDF